MLAPLSGAKGKRKMPQSDITDPIILAAMIEDEDETPEEKAAREELMENAGVAPDNQDKEDEDTDDDAEGEDPAKPLEAEDDTADDVDEDEEAAEKTRKEKRQERKDDFIQSIRKDKVKRTTQDIPNYKPIDYASEDREFKPEELAKDREMVGAIGYAKGAKEAAFWAEQDQFWGELGSEAKILAYDPKLNFLAEQMPDGKKNDSFDPDKTSEINEMYLEMVGYKQHPKRDNNGRILVDNTGTPLISHITVDRTDLSYEKFARRYVNNMTNWAEDFADTKVDETKQDIIKQRKKLGIRPDSGKRKSIGTLNPGDISRMSDEDFDKYEDEIDRQINSELGI